MNRQLSCHSDCGTVGKKRQVVNIDNRPDCGAVGKNRQVVNIDNRPDCGAVGKKLQVVNSLNRLDCGSAGKKRRAQSGSECGGIKSSTQTATNTAWECLAGSVLSVTDWRRCDRCRHSCIIPTVVTTDTVVFSTPVVDLDSLVSGNTWISIFTLYVPVSVCVSCVSVCVCVCV